jgi:hypothetical protein
MRKPRVAVPQTARAKPSGIPNSQSEKDSNAKITPAQAYVARRGQSKPALEEGDSTVDGLEGASILNPPGLDLSSLPVGIDDAGNGDGSRSARRRGSELPMLPTSPAPSSFTYPSSTSKGKRRVEYEPRSSGQGTPSLPLLPKSPALPGRKPAPSPMRNGRVARGGVGGSGDGPWLGSPYGASPTPPRPLRLRTPSPDRYKRRMVELSAADDVKRANMATVRMWTFLWTHFVECENHNRA